MRIDEFSATFSGSFTPVERIRFISVGFDVTVFPDTVDVGMVTRRNLQLSRKNLILGLSG